MKFFVAWSLLLSLAAQMLYAQFPVTRKAGTYRVIARSGLNMRAAANLQAKTLQKLPYAVDVQLIDEGYDQLRLGWMEGFWAKVRYEGKEGFVYGPYLTQLPLPADEIAPDDCETDIYGFEQILGKYIHQQLDTAAATQIIFQSDPIAEDDYRQVQFQWYQDHIQVINTTFYESGSTALRVPGSDIFQLYAFLEALLIVCPSAFEEVRSPTFIRDHEGRIIEIRDREYDGYIFRIRQIDAVTAEIEMSSGV